MFLSLKLVRTGFGPLRIHGFAPLPLSSNLPSYCLKNRRYKMNEEQKTRNDERKYLLSNQSEQDEVRQQIY